MRFEHLGWTWGAEHEWADWDIRSVLPFGCSHNAKDFTVVNSNGIANDPSGKLYEFGGEINTRPTRNIEEQVALLYALRIALPNARVNYRSNLHIHVRVPGLKNNLAQLKRVQRYIHKHCPALLEIVEPIPEPIKENYEHKEAYAGAMRRYKRRLVSHHTLLPAKRWQSQMQAKRPGEFFILEAPWDDKRKRPLYHLQPRVCVSLRQMLETDTIEFRHFPGTLDADLFRNCLTYCGLFLRYALDDLPVNGLMRKAKGLIFPNFPPYNHEMELSYRRTCADGTVSKEAREAAILELLK